MDEVTRRFLVSGRVQGVYFRHSARFEAHRLGLRGFARNLPDGSVEVLARGAPSAIEELKAWLHRGPPQARVERVEEIPAGDDSVTTSDGTIPDGFESR